MFTIYSKPNCGWCHMAKRFLNKKGMKYTEIDISKDLESRQWLIDQGFKTVPQIYNDDILIEGGYEGLVKCL